MQGNPQYDDDFMRTANGAAQTEVGPNRQSLVEVKKGRRSLTEYQVNFYRRLDAALADVYIPPDMALACDEGCSYCCHYHVYVTAPEALAIATHLKLQWSAEELNEAKRRLKANAAAVAGLTKEQHVFTNVTCAFLASNGSCSIYTMRPAACRKHHSFDATPCRESYEDPSRDDPSPQSADRLAIAQGMYTGAIAAMELEGSDSARYEMSAAILEALENSSSFRRWRDGKNSFPLVRDRDTDRVT